MAIIKLGSISIELNKSDLTSKVFPGIPEQLRESVTIKRGKVKDSIEFVFRPNTDTREDEWVLLSRAIDKLRLPPDHVLNKKIVDCNLSVRAQKILQYLKIETLGDLVLYSRSRLLQMHNMGKKTIEELEQLLEGYGLDFKNQ